MPEKSTFLRNWNPVRGPMSFAAKEKGKRVKKRLTNPRQTNTSHCPTKTIAKTGIRPLNGVDREKSAVFKELTQSFRTYELRGQAKKRKKSSNRIKDKQVPHTLLQKLSPKSLTSPLKHKFNSHRRDQRRYQECLQLLSLSEQMTTVRFR